MKPAIAILGAIFATVIFSLILISQYSMRKNLRNSLRSISTNSPSPSAIPSLPEEDFIPIIKKQVAEKTGNNEEEIEIVVDKRSGNFAEGRANVFQENISETWYGVNTDGQWNMVYTGNDLIDCSVADKYKFPTDIVASCRDMVTGETLERSGY